MSKLVKIPLHVIASFLFIKTAYAEPIALTCVKHGGTSSYVVEFDESIKTAKTNFGISIAKITASEIIFIASTKDGVNYLHTINRSNGNLTIFNESTGKFVTPYTCNKTTQKF